MIVYNVKRRWFTMKADAEVYRKAEGLPPSGTFKLVVDDRDDLAALLNGLCAPEPEAPLFPNLEQPDPIVEVIERNRVVDSPPDYVPMFLVREWQAKNKRKEE